MVAYSQWLQWVLQDAFTGVVLGGIVLAMFVIGFVYRLASKAVGKKKGPPPAITRDEPFRY